MSKIKIKNFGPIKGGYQENGGWLEVKKVTVFIGNQGSGKSTVAKLISTFSWMEKALTRGDYNAKDFTDYNRFRKNYCAYHRLENYFFDLEGNDQAEIEYTGSSYYFKYDKGNLTIKPLDNAGKYHLPQIMYVPAERNFISNVKSPKALKLTSDSLVEFVTEFDNAKAEIKGSMQLPINGVALEYQKLNDILSVKGKDYRVQLKEASSGYQSIVPLYLVSWYLAHSIKAQSESAKSMSSDELERFRKGVEEIWQNQSLTDEQRRVALSVLSSKFNKSAFINIVEEPEQNLFPSSQRQMLHCLLAFNNMNEGNQLIMTTHSPYLINYLSIAMYGATLLDRIKVSDNANNLIERLDGVVPKESVIHSNDVAVYQMEESDGSISQLPQPEGIPSDKNELNQSIRLGNLLFDQLLELEEEL